MSEERRRQEELNRQRNQFAQMVARGQVAARDRFGRVIKEGDRIILKTDVDLIFDVTSIGPVLDPQMAPGLLRLNLAVAFPLNVIGNQPYMQALVVGRAKIDAEKPSEAESNGAGDPAERQIVTTDAEKQDPPGPKLVVPPLDEPPT